MGNRFLTAEELDAKGKEFQQLHKDFVLSAGLLLAEVKKRTTQGNWGRFCRENGITRRKADQYIFVASSRIADKLQRLGIAKALLLARHEDRARELLKNEAVAAMTVKDLEAKLRGTGTKRAAATRAGKAAGYRQGFADGQNTSALVVWAAGVLFMRPGVLAEPNVRTVAQEHYALLRQLLSNEYHGTLDEALQTLEAETSRTAAAA